MATWHGKGRKSTLSHKQHKRKKQSSSTSANHVRNKTPSYVNMDMVIVYKIRPVYSREG